MKTNFITITVALLTLLGFASCNKENQVFDGDTDVSKTSLVTFSIAFPAGDPITYAIHDQDEYRITSLMLYEFDNQGKLLSEADIASKLTPTGVAASWKYEKVIKEENRGVRQFVLVANEQVEGVTVGTTTLSELQAKVAKKTLKQTAPSAKDIIYGTTIPMTGYAEQGGSKLISITGAPAILSVEMERIVARIDVENSVEGLVISDVKLKGANSHSYLFEQKATYAAISGNTKVSAITPFAAYPPEFGYGKVMKKAFYLYENGEAITNEGEALRIEITAKLSDRDVFYSIPFWLDGKEVPIKRNHIYKLKLGGNVPIKPGSNVSFTIETADWNEVHMHQPFAAIAIKGDPTGITNTGTFDKETQTLSIDNTEHSAIGFAFASEFEGHTSFTASVAGTPYWCKAYFTGDNLTITAKANDTGKPRVTTVVITSNADADTKFFLKVKQAQ